MTQTVSSTLFIKQRSLQCGSSVSARARGILPDENAVVERIINPAVEEVLKAVMAKYTAEEIITKRGEVKAGVDNSLTTF
jgi:regulator of protease activity HflC (stomatin/prohibitin superfamily)